MIATASTLHRNSLTRNCLQTFAAGGTSACLDTKSDGSTFVPSRAKFQTFTCNSFQCVWYLRLGSGAPIPAGSTKGGQSKKQDTVLAATKKATGGAGAAAMADSVAQEGEGESRALDKIETWWRKKFSKQGQCTLASSAEELPQLLEINRQRREAKYQKKLRKKAKEEAKLALATAATAGWSENGG